MAAMTTRERVQALVSHGDYDEYLIAAVLDVDVSAVARVLADPSYEPPAPGASGDWNVVEVTDDHTAAAGEFVLITDTPTVGPAADVSVTTGSPIINAPDGNFTDALVGRLIDDQNWIGLVPAGATVFS